MPERFKPLRKSFHRFWHPFRMRYSFSTIPVVSAMLRPPATVCHPCGMNRNDSKTTGDSFPPKIPDEPSFPRTRSTIRLLGIIRDVASPCLRRFVAPMSLIKSPGEIGRVLVTHPDLTFLKKTPVHSRWMPKDG